MSFSSVMKSMPAVAAAAYVAFAPVSAKANGDVWATPLGQKAMGYGWTASVNTGDVSGSATTEWGADGGCRVIIEDDLRKTVYSPATGIGATIFRGPAIKILGSDILTALALDYNTETRGKRSDEVAEIKGAYNQVEKALSANLAPAINGSAVIAHFRQASGTLLSEMSVNGRAVKMTGPLGQLAIRYGSINHEAAVAACRPDRRADVTAATANPA